MVVSKDSKFKGSVRVAARIIDRLSSGLYPNPAACLKELINNAYDADATIVRVFVKPDADQIVIQDNGHGFTQESFEEHFANVSESKKRDDGETSNSGRKKIGMIGIGFIAANELCEEVEVFSTCKGSKDIMHVSLNFDEMSKPPKDRKGKDGKYKKADYEGEILTTAEDNDHYTEIYLKRIKGDSKEILTSASLSTSKTNEMQETNWSLYGLLPETVRNKLLDPRLERWEQFDFYSKTMVEIALNVPVQYHEGWHPSLKKMPYLSKITKDVETRDFKVLYDGSDLKKPIVLRSDRDFITEKFNFEGEHVKATGYFFASHGTICPRVLKGVLLRIRDSAVGSYRKDFLGFPPAEKTLFQNWITCEVYASDELEKAMNIDRVTFRDTHPVYIELRDAIHDNFRKFLGRVHEELYVANRDKKQKIRRQESLKNIKNVSTSISIEYPKSAKEITKMWSDESVTQREILKTYTPAEILEMVSETARKILSKELSEQFISELNKKFFTNRRD